MADPSILAFSFSLGAAAFFSPCGIPMLPAYLAYYLPRGAQDEAPHAALLRGLGGGALAGLGAMLVLLAIGGLAALLGAPFKERVVLFELAGGVLVIGLGLAMLTGRGPALRMSLQPRRRRDALGLMAFGALYATVAASCVVPLLLTVLYFAFRAANPLEGALYVGAYALGLALLLVAATLAVATTQRALLQRMKAWAPRIEKVSGVLLVAAGLYLIWFWAAAEFGIDAPPTWTPPFI